MAWALEHDCTGSNQLGELLSLVGIKEGVQLLQGGGDSLLKALSALHLGLAGRVDGLGVKGLPEERLCIAIGHPAAINGGLGPFSLEFAQDRGQCPNLGLAQPELMAQEAQGAADTEGGASGHVPWVVSMVGEGVAPSMRVSVGHRGAAGTAAAVPECT